jgi:hypothetical protein
MSPAGPAPTTIVRSASDIDRSDFTVWLSLSGVRPFAARRARISPGRGKPVAAPMTILEFRHRPPHRQAAGPAAAFPFRQAGRY